ncbi:hypothetical protein RB595_001116 [Gaeumannomyces hyphopodioides]
MADPGQINGGTVPGTDQVRHSSPGLRHQHTTIATSSTTQTTTTSSLPIDLDPTLAPAPAPVHFATLPRPSGSHWLFSPYSDALDFSDFDLASPPATTTPSAAALAPQHRQPQAGHPLLHVPAFPLPLPQPSLDPSPVASHLFLHAAGSIFSSPPPPTGFAGLLAARPGSQLHSPSFSFADRSFPPRLPPLMPPRQSLEQQTRLERLLSSLADNSPSPRPRSSRRPRNSSPASPSDRSGSRPDHVKTERAGSRTPAPVDAPAIAMPVVTRKRAAAAAAGAAAASSSSSSSSSSSRPAGATAQPQARAPKRPRTTAQQPANRQRPNPITIDSEAFSDPFDEGADLEDLERRATGGLQKGPQLKEEDELADIIDLVDDDVPPPPPKPKSDNQVKLGNMQCSICMDDMTNLTVTHCGHLFCGECLHGALHANLNKSVCPICRQKIDPRANGPQNPKTTKGFFHLQLKLMTATRKGKMKEGGAAR